MLVERLPRDLSLRPPRFPRYHEHVVDSLRETRLPLQPPSILHVDMDSFFASVEVRDGLARKGEPVIVAGSGARGVVLSATYEARAFGVKAAMPVGQARRVCPGGKFLEPRFDAYWRYSRAVMGILESFSPLVEQASLDEAYMDVSGCRRLFGDAPAIAAKIQGAIAHDLGLPSSVGAGPNKAVAKLASARAKPMGVLVVDACDVEGFLAELPVSKLNGVGAVTLRTLASMGIRLVGELADTPFATLVAYFGRAQGEYLHDLSRGIDTRVVEPVRQARSLSHERTYEEDLSGDVTIARELLRLADELARRLRGAELCARTVTLKVRLGSMKTLSRSKTLADPTDLSGILSQTAVELYGDLALNQPRVRLLGISAGNLSAAGIREEQLSLAGQDSPDWNTAERAADEVRKRFGDQSIGRVSLHVDPRADF